MPIIAQRWWVGAKLRWDKEITADGKTIILTMCITRFVTLMDVICITIIPQKEGKGIELYRSNIYIHHWN